MSVSPAVSSPCDVTSEEEAATTTEEVKNEVMDLDNLSEENVANEIVDADKQMDCTNDVQANDAADVAYTDEVDRNMLEVLPPEKSEALTYVNDETGVAKFDGNLSAIENLRNLTSSLDVIQRNRSNYYTLSYPKLHH